jgi:hypothetical protein
MAEDIHHLKLSIETYTGAQSQDRSDQTDRLSKRHRFPIRNGNNLNVFKDRSMLISYKPSLWKVTYDSIQFSIAEKPYNSNTLYMVWQDFCNGYMSIHGNNPTWHFWPALAVWLPGLSSLP